MLTPAEPRGERAIHGARGNRDLQIPGSRIEIGFAAEIVAVQRPGQPFAFVEMAVVVEVHPTGEQAADAGHGDPQRVDTLFEDAAVADDDDAVVVVADQAFAGGNRSRDAVHFAVDAGSQLEARRARSGAARWRPRWCCSVFGKSPQSLSA